MPLIGIAPAKGSAATTTVTPATCPACGFSFGLADVATVSGHFLGHLVLRETRVDPTAPDW